MTHAGTREIARAAVRAQLAQVASDLYARRGFDTVTINDLATAAGVSRSTFLRYFDSKEDAALAAFDDRGAQIAAALRARPADEDDWTALRRALDVVLDSRGPDRDEELAKARLVQDTPALRARWLDKQHGWRPGLAHALAERPGHFPPADLSLEVKASAAIDCFTVALEHWTASEGRLDLADLLDQAFATFNPQQAPHTVGPTEQTRIR
ncbi:acyl-CoA-like ligand-binding transcription factor [Nocardia pseudobrasiliensis]|uniref:TetR family transcriptional regulator n=1 Tax=Nocardia pseudobrasiliensis TaxID=45979 RepID=A0A370I8L4_9NOCA|nr:TetR family transcriptional regulator [Nocardia pseudobrasiliensis]RDI66950.1 TetR family transcriptional regulator [Nocardia pseudobrasiliensis]